MLVLASLLSAVLSDPAPPMQEPVVVRPTRVPTQEALERRCRSARLVGEYGAEPHLVEDQNRDGVPDLCVHESARYPQVVDECRVFSARRGSTIRRFPVFAVTAVPDEKKGERFAVLTTLGQDKLPAVLEKVAASGLPNLFLPRLDAFVQVEALPLLGTGKLDLKRVKQVALEKLGAPGS